MAVKQVHVALVCAHVQMLGDPCGVQSPSGLPTPPDTRLVRPVGSRFACGRIANTDGGAKINSCARGVFALYYAR